MYRSHFLSHDYGKVTAYKKYSYTLSHLISKNKNIISNCNLKSTWKFIGNLIQRESKGQSYPTRIVYGNKTFTNTVDIAEQLKTYLFSKCWSKSSWQTGCWTFYQSYSVYKLLPFVLLCDIPSDRNLRLYFAGVDETNPNKFIKLAADHLATPFSKIYNESSMTGNVPDILKMEVLVNLGIIGQ